MNRMNQDHIKRVELATEDSQDASRIAAGLAQNASENVRQVLSVPLIWKQLQWISTSFPNLNKILSANIVEETINEIALFGGKKLVSLPSITYIIPVHNCDPELISLTIESLANQIAVQIQSIFIIDGESSNDAATLANCLADKKQLIGAKVIQHDANKGVAAARNTGMKQITTEFFSWLDANDIIHPLRSIHGILRLINNGAIRINTSYARAILKTGKLVLRNHKFGHIGHTSFIATKEILDKFGYLVDLRAHEDTEYQRRLEYFNANMCSTEVIGHYLDLNPGSSSHLHLSHDTWESLEIIEGHSYLGATYSGKATAERQAIALKYGLFYEKILRESLMQSFPADFKTQ